MEAGQHPTALEHSTIETDCLCKTETYSDDEDHHFNIQTSYDSDETETETELETESETDDILLSDLLLTSKIKLEPVDQPVQLLDGTSIHNHSSVSVKTELEHDQNSPGPSTSTEYCYKCRICAEYLP